MKNKINKITWFIVACFLIVATLGATSAITDSALSNLLGSILGITIFELIRINVTGEGN